MDILSPLPNVMHLFMIEKAIIQPFASSHNILPHFRRKHETRSFAQTLSYEWVVANIKNLRSTIRTAHIA